MDRPRSPSVAAAIAPLIPIATAALIVAMLARAQAVVVPLALAILLAFVLTPLVKLLEAARLPRVLAVILTMSVALGALGGFGWIIRRQFDELTGQLTQYTASMQRKVAALKAGGSTIDALQKTVDKVGRELDEKVDDPRRVQSVRLVPAEQKATERFRELVVPVLEPLANVLIVLVLVVFTLLQREDLRDRLVRLFGADNVTVTTRTMDETAQRMTRFLASQSIINVGFGALVATGLYFIGVPYALLWGGVVSVLRFVPYVGSTLSMIMPALLAFALFPGWRQVGLTVALYLGLDAVTAYFIEPLLIGKRTGVSSIALLVSAIFWTWLWGPVGLVLSTPLTVSLAVLGRQVKALQLLSVLLGDEPALSAELSYYQRLLARDDDEATELVERQRVELGSAGLMDKVLVPALTLAAQDRERDEITAEDATFVATASRQILQQLAGAQPANVPSGTRQRVIGIPARRAADEALLEMLKTLLDPAAVDFQVLPISVLTGEVLEQVAAAQPRLVCIAALPPSGGAKIRSLCRRLRARIPEVSILVLRPVPEGTDATAELALSKEAGADRTASSLQEGESRARELLTLG